MKIKDIKISNIIPGMKAYGDVYNDLGILIYRSGYILKEESITKLELYGIKKIRVEIPEEIEYTATDDEEEVKEIEEETEFSKRIKAKPEYKKFELSYRDAENEAKNKLLEIVSGKESSRRKLLDITENVTENCSTNKELFEYMSSIVGSDLIYSHSINVSVIAKTIGAWLNLSQTQIGDLGVAGLLHDIGKAAIPEEILNKKGRLTDEEYEEVKKHPIYSYRLAQKQNVNEDVLRGILMHHERFNGSGYPLGVKGKQIPLYARILAIADVFDAMTSNRVYRAGMCPFKVLDNLEEEGFRSFDPKIIGIVLEGIANTYVGDTVELNNGQIGKVVFINKRVARPIIEVNGEMFDLSKEDPKSIFIERIL